MEMIQLLCPKCKSRLTKVDKTMKCENHHSYDLAREGYVNLLLNKTNSGDNLEMVEARKNFLSSGHYDFLVDYLVDILKNYDDIIDCGCGEGYYTNKISQILDKNIVAFDISKSAISKAAKKNNNNTYFVGSIYNILIDDNQVDCVLNICAPFSEKEFIRILKNGGRIVKVIPAKNHLLELKQFLYDKVYLNDETVKTDNLKEENRTYLSRKVTINNQDLMNLFKMTPYYFRTKNEDITRLNNLESLEITFSFEVIIYEVNDVFK